MPTPSNTGTQQHLVDKLHQVGWFIPPYAGVQRINYIAQLINRSATFGPPDLEQILSALYPANVLASMVVNRYPHTPVVETFQEIIAESVESHFLKLNHIAASGLAPVVEGIARRLAQGHGITIQNFTGPSGVIEALTAHCRQHVVTNQVGTVGECLSLLDSFELFLSKVLFANTNKQHKFEDGTNRHGMLHAVFADSDFGSPLNFYKVITAVNALTWMSAVYHGGSGFVPDETPRSKEYARYYRLLSEISSKDKPGRQP